MSVLIQFDSNQEFQTEAVDSVINLFLGSEESYSDGESENVLESDSLFQEKLFPNRLSISRDRLIANIRTVQSLKRTNIHGKSELIVPLDLVKTIKNDEWPTDFAVEMETGTGKTYVYLKTAIELNLKYGLSKFVIVVPSVAIREGVMSTLRLTKSHFKEIYLSHS